MRLFIKFLMIPQGSRPQANEFTSFEINLAISVSAKPPQSPVEG